MRLDVRNIRKEKDIETKKDMAEDYIDKYLSQYDVDCWFSSGMTAKLSNLVDKLNIKELHIWGLNQVRIICFKTEIETIKETEAYEGLLNYYCVDYGFSKDDFDNDLPVSDHFTDTAQEIKNSFPNFDDETLQSIQKELESDIIDYFLD